MSKYYAHCLLCKKKFMYAYWLVDCEAYIYLRHHMDDMLCTECLQNR